MLSALIQRSVEYVGVRQVVPAIGEKKIYQNDKIKSTKGVSMPSTVDGKMVDGRTIVLDHPLATGQQEVLVRKKRRAGRTKIPVPEQFVLAIAEMDIEELSL